MKIAVIQFPGSNCDYDTIHVLNQVLCVETHLVWHKCSDLSDYNAVILPGGFSYGDRLRAGIIAAHSPVMKAIKTLAKEGKPVLGICNGFQILVESGLLPGALLRNSSLKFVCKWINLSVMNKQSVFTKKIVNNVIKMPIAHNEGRYFIEDNQLNLLYKHNQIVFKYVNEEGVINGESNPNGSVDNIAGICNLEGNVLGLMPHPERASEGVLNPFQTDHGKLLFKSMLDNM